jgi:hypothetical protein
MYMAHLNLPLDDSLLARIDEARGKQPRTSWLRDAIALKLGTPTILDSPMVPHETPDNRPGALPKPPKEALRGTGPPVINPVSPPTQEYLEAKKLAREQAVKDCAHKYRDRHNTCIQCGQQWH